MRSLQVDIDKHFSGGGPLFFEDTILFQKVNDYLDWLLGLDEWYFENGVLY